MIRRAITIIKNEGVVSLVDKSFSYFEIYSRLYFVMGKIIDVFDRITSNEKIVLCGSQRGYEGNSRFVYEWIIQNDSNMEAVWMAKNRREARRLKSRNVSAINCRSLCGLRMLISASHSVININLNDIAIDPLLVPSSVTSVFAGHGVSLPKKKLIPERPINDYDLNHDYYIASSKKQQNYSIWRKIGTRQDTNIPKKINDSYEITGFPKTDLLINPSEEIKSNWEKFSSGNTDKTVILYAPTHGEKNVDSQSIQKNIFPFDDFDAQELDEYLKIHDFHLYIRPHPRDLKNMRNYSYGSYSLMKERINKICEKSDRVSLATSRDISTIEILAFTDVLITDTSEVYIEFLPRDNPIIFVDQNCYDAENQISYEFDYDNYKPGLTVGSFSMLRRHIVNINSGGDSYADERKSLTNEFYKYTDSGARERVVNLIE